VEGVVEGHTNTYDRNSSEAGELAMGMSRGKG
jgi:hypothetical protein